jgi:hypothetical protein
MDAQYILAIWGYNAFMDLYPFSSPWPKYPFRMKVKEEIGGYGVMELANRHGLSFPIHLPILSYFIIYLFSLFSLFSYSLL